MNDKLSYIVGHEYIWRKWSLTTFFNDEYVIKKYIPPPELEIGHDQLYRILRILLTFKINSSLLKVLNLFLLDTNVLFTSAHSSLPVVNYLATVRPFNISSTVQIVQLNEYVQFKIANRGIECGTLLSRFWLSS